MNNTDKDFLVKFLTNPPLAPSMMVDLLMYLAYALVGCAIVVRIFFLKLRGQQISRDFFNFDKGSWGRAEGIVVTMLFTLAFVSVAAMYGLVMLYDL